MASKKRGSGRNKGPRQGISGNPQRRAEQLAQRQPATMDEQDLSSLRDAAYSPAGVKNPSPWWAESHQRILAAARAATWPARLADLETQTCQLVGDEFYERLNSEQSGFHPPHWLGALAEAAGAALQTSVADAAGEWPQLWSLLCGLALTVPPGGIEDETVQAEAEQAARLLATHGLTADFSLLADGARPAGDPQVAQDGYGTRFLLVAPFAYDGGMPRHWYAWDVDSCFLLTVVGAGVFGSPQEALTEWQHAVGPAATGTELSPAAPELTARLLAPGLETGQVADTLTGFESRELLREYYRLRRRARVLVPAADAEDSSDGDDPSLVRDAFLAWYATRPGAVRPDAADAVDIILHEWGPLGPAAERTRYACSPHRIQLAARVIRDAYEADYANEALRLLPEWTQWCIERSGLTGDLAARSRGAALTEAAALVDEATYASPADEPPFRPQE